MKNKTSDPPSPASPAPSANYKSIILVCCMVASLVPLMGSALNLALPDINAEFGLSAKASGWIATSYLLATAIFQIPAARVADIVGRKVVFIIGVAVFFVFSVLSGLATSGGSLIAFRALSGVGSAMVFSTNVAILTAAVPHERRGWALGINTATVYFSIAAGPFVGGILTQAFGWHSIFFLAAAMCLIVLVATPFVLRDNWRSPEGRQFDLGGTAIYALGLSALIYGFSSLPSVAGFVLLGAGVVILTLFTVFEKRQQHPVFNIRLFLGNRLFRHGCLSALINYACTMCISFMLSLYLQYIRGLSPTGAGTILIGQSLVMAVVSLASGRLSDRIEPRKMASTGMLVIAVGLVCLCFLTETTPFWYIIAILAVIGFGFGIFSSPNMNIIMSSVAPEQYGLASATTGTMRLVGQSFSMGLAMMAMSLYIGAQQISADLHSELLASIRLTFIISAALCAIGVYSSSVRSKHL